MGSAGVAAVAEIPVTSPIPLYKIPGWRERLGVVAGITGRGNLPGRGFDLGLWSEAPIGEVMSRWQAFRRAQTGFHAIMLGHQVHGAAVLTVESGRGWSHVEGIDGWVTTTPGILLTVTIADCIPVYLAAPGGGVALLHAGWRGTAAGILGAGVEALVAAAKCNPTNLVMHLGVGICGSCYEVGSEVMDGCGVKREGQGPWHLDLRSHLAAQACDLGVGQVTSSTWCSAHDRSFYSHRASKGADGRMVAFAGIPGNP